MEENFEGEELDNIITLNDEEGNEVKFEFLDLVELDDEEYVVLSNKDITVSSVKSLHDMFLVSSITSLQVLVNVKYLFILFKLFSSMPVYSSLSFLFNHLLMYEELYSLLSPLASDVILLSDIIVIVLSLFIFIILHNKFEYET